MEKKKVISCAVYTRKSTEEGLEQQYNTLDAQRDAGESYIQSQRHEGWEVLPTRYDDGGFTGGKKRLCRRRMRLENRAKNNPWKYKSLFYNL